ncbi:copper resistance protein B [uncultured Brevundimonas sp.]|uniref:copper resistance protein B n=1 Tax=uncultured Brevundimonas sp. TaxID=213418 RepID=UPI0030EB632D
MNRLVIALAPLVLAAAPAAAQNPHAGHARPPAARPAPAPAPRRAPTPAPRATPPAARPAPAPRPVPRPATAAPAPAPDPHAGHAMPAEAAAVDPHAGHAMPGEPQVADPHAGHDMATMTPEAADPHAGHDMGGMAMPPDVPTSADTPGRPPEDPVPAAALGAPTHAADLIFGAEAMAESRRTLIAENGDIRTTVVIIDRLEAHVADGEAAWLWDVQGWTGGDINRFWWKSEGEGDVSDGLEAAEIQALYSRAVTPFWDVQAGVRHDIRPDGEDTTHLVFGLQGLAPHWWEVDAAAFLSTEGDLTARVEAEYDQRLTQRLILQPRFEIDLAARDIPELGIGAGLGTIEAGLRLRYEIRRELAPYIGVEWTRRLGATGDFARARGEDVDAVRAVLGLKAWF